MNEQRILHIRESISVARDVERENHQLQEFVAKKSSDLHDSIRAPSDNKAQDLYAFVLHYIELVPDLLSAVKFLSKSTGILKKTEIFYRIAEDYLMSPLQEVGSHNGLLAFINEAYFTHRLIEELNDKINIAFGAPIVPFDMTTSNLVVHEIIGEEIANKLDGIIFYLIESTFNNDDIPITTHSHYKMQHDNIDWERVLKSWPNLKDTCPFSMGDTTVELCGTVH